MRRANIKIMVLAGLLAVCWAGLRSAAANDLESIGVTRQGDSIAVTITSSTACEYNAFLTEDKPERIVVDLSGVINNLSNKQFANLPLKSIKSIRTSQYKSLPDAEARVVLDVHRPIEFTHISQGNNITVKFAIVPDELASVNWHSSYPTRTVASKPDVQAPVEKPAPVVSEAPKPITKPIEEVKTPTAPVTTQSAVVEETAEPTPTEEVTAETQPVPVQQYASPVPTPQGIQVAAAPKRKTVEYTSEDIKDPFETLVGMGTGKMVDGLPSLENLKLVGILTDNRTSSALLEDGEGNGYILKPNDRIQSGFLVSVVENKATFQVTEYGWTRTVALELQVPDIK